jgi:hypothetical protein
MSTSTRQPKEMIVTLDTGRKKIGIEGSDPEQAAFDVMRNGLKIWDEENRTMTFYPPHRIDLVEIRFPGGTDFIGQD